MATPSKKRCDWANVSPLMQAYHDTEWGVPLHDDQKLFEFLVLDGAQAGLSWSTILNKRENYRSAFDNFDPKKVARYTPRRVEKLLQDPGIVRNRRKIESAIRNAKAFLAIQDEFSSFDAYLWRFVDGKPNKNRFRSMSQIPATSPESDALSNDLKQRGFSFAGSTIVYAFMQAAGLVNDHITSCFRYNDVQGL